MEYQFKSTLANNYYEALLNGGLTEEDCYNTYDKTLEELKEMLDNNVPPDKDFSTITNSKIGTGLWRQTIMGKIGRIGEAMAFGGMPDESKLRNWGNVINECAEEINHYLKEERKKWTRN